MAGISPVSEDLQDAFEGSSIDVTFTPILTSDETLVSINIVDYEATQGVEVDDVRIHGTFESVFDLGQDSLMYRENDDIKSTDAWKKLPPAETVDLFLWRAPRNLVKRFNYVVEMVYIYTPPPPEPDPENPGGNNRAANEGGTTPIRMTLRKEYFKDIYGDYSRWAQQLRAYVYARS